MKRTPNRGWSQSERWRAIARAAIANWNRKTRPTLPKCGARRKHDGQPCQQLAMANGRCRWHGGSTGKGKLWHKTVWPNGNAPDAEAKLTRKLAAKDKADRARRKRLAKMTDEERAKYAEWQGSHRPGPAAPRARLRARRKADREARRIIEARLNNQASADGTAEGPGDANLPDIFA